MVMAAPLVPGQRVEIYGHLADVVTVRPTTVEIQWLANSERVWVPKTLPMTVQDCCRGCQTGLEMKVC